MCEKPPKVEEVLIFEFPPDHVKRCTNLAMSAIFGNTLGEGIISNKAQRRWNNLMWLTVCTHYLNFLQRSLVFLCAGQSVKMLWLLCHLGLNLGLVPRNNDLSFCLEHSCQGKIELDWKHSSVIHVSNCCLDLNAGYIGSHYKTTIMQMFCVSLSFILELYKSEIKYGGWREEHPKILYLAISWILQCYLNQIFLLGI